MSTLAPSHPGAGRESTGTTRGIDPGSIERRRSTGAGGRRMRHRLVVLSFMGPSFIGLAVFFVYPLLAAVYFSFTRVHLVNKPEWVGLQNWKFLFEDLNVREAASNTLWFVAVQGAGPQFVGRRDGPPPEPVPPPP